MQVKRYVVTLVLSAFLLSAFAQRQVKGTVRDAGGDPIIGAMVTADGKPVAVTDINGEFTIPSASSNSSIVLSSMGYLSQTIALGNRTRLDVVLEEDVKALDEVVMVGYNTIRKNDLTGAVGSVNTEKLNAKGAPSVLENLQGAVPGVSITKSSGRAASGFNIEIRGKNSISSNQSPLYVVDGVICDDIDFLNPQDIERIDILKDASSTAIYGSRATAGVVMVTTRGGVNAGKESKPVISYDAYYGISDAARLPEFLSPEDFYRYRFMKFLTYAGGSANGGKPMFVNEDIERCLLVDRETGIYRMKELLANGKTYNWPDFVLQQGRQQNHYLSVSGSAAQHHYYIGVGYSDEIGTFKGDSQSKFNFKGSFDAEINKYFSAGFNMNMARIDHDYASDNAVSYAFRINPFMQPYDENGNINVKPGAKEALHTDEYQFTSQISPLVYMEDEWRNRATWMMLGNVYLQLQPMKDLRIKSTFSPNFSLSRTGFFRGTDAGETQNEAQYDQSMAFSWTWDNLVTYDHSFGTDHHLSLMGLMSSTAAKSESFDLTYNKVMEGTYWWNLGSTDNGYNNLSSGNGYGENSMLSYALRANYVFKGKYLLTGTVRWDGSSKFAPGNRWGSFPSMAAAWRLSEEEFMASAEWLSNLKLRVSYGVTGNNNVGNYATQLTVSGPNYYAFGDTYYQGMYPSGVVNQNLRWEKSHEINGGFDFGFFDERIRGSVDFYNKTSTDLLYSVQLPLQGQRMTTNVGSVNNRGVEIALTTENIATEKLHWSTTFSFAHNENEVLEVNGTGNYYSGSSTGNLIIGQPYNNIYGYVWDGIVSDRDMKVPDTEIASLMGFTPGETVKEYQYYYTCYGLIEGNPIIVDMNGDGKFTDADKKVYKSDPDWTGSLTSNLQYGNWDFGFSIYAKQNYTVFSNFYNEYLALSDRGRTKMNVDWYIPAGTLLDCDGIDANGLYINPKYQETTHYGDYPFPNYSADNNGVGTENWLGSTNSYVDASYVKVKNITLGYTLPKDWIERIGCASARLYATVTNPFVFTDYKGYDPEWASASLSGDGPSIVSWQFGANIKF